MVYNYRVSGFAVVTGVLALGLLTGVLLLVHGRTVGLMAVAACCLLQPHRFLAPDAEIRGGRLAAGRVWHDLEGNLTARPCARRIAERTSTNE